MTLKQLLGWGIVFVLILPVAFAVTESYGPYHSLEIRDGAVWAMGRGDYGQLGMNGSSYNWTHVPGIAGAVSVAAGGLHSLALTADGIVYGWGYNGHHQLTDDDAPFYTAPIVLYSGALNINATTTLTFIETAEGIRVQGNDGEGIVNARRRLADAPVPKAVIEAALQRLRAPVEAPQPPLQADSPTENGQGPPAGNAKIDELEQEVSRLRILVERLQNNTVQSVPSLAVNSGGDVVVTLS